MRTDEMDAQWWARAGTWCLQSESLLAERTGEGFWVLAEMLGGELEGRTNPEAIAMLDRLNATVEAKRCAQ